MKMLISIPVLFAAVSLAFAAPAPAAAGVEEPTWGKPVNGLRLGLRRAKTAKGGNVRVTAILDNVSGDDLILNLGIMLANGKRQLPTAVRLTLSDADGKTRTLVRKVGGIAGRVDPFVVPLAAGCRYEVACELGQFADADRPDVSPVPGEYRMGAEFVGEAVTKTNRDVTGLALMTYWTGTIRTGEVKMIVPAKPKLERKIKSQRASLRGSWCSPATLPGSPRGKLDHAGSYLSVNAVG